MSGHQNSQTEVEIAALKVLVMSLYVETVNLTPGSIEEKRLSADRIATSAKNLVAVVKVVGENARGVESFREAVIKEIDVYASALKPE